MPGRFPEEELGGLIDIERVNDGVPVIDLQNARQCAGARRARLSGTHRLLRLLDEFGAQGADGAVTAGRSEMRMGGYELCSEQRLKYPFPLGIAQRISPMKCKAQLCRHYFNRLLGAPFAARALGGSASEAAAGLGRGVR